MSPYGHAHRSGRRRKSSMQTATFGQGHGHRGTGTIQSRAWSAVGVPVDELHETGFIRERRRDNMAAAALEDKAGLRAVDAHLLHLRIREMLRERTKWSDRCEHAAPELLRVFVSRSGHVRTLLLADYSPNELVDPTLIVHTQARPIAASELGCKLGLDKRPDASFGGRCCAGNYAHGDLLPYRPEATAIASSGLEMGASV